LYVFLFMTLQLSRFTLFPYTTLFRSLILDFSFPGRHSPEREPRHTDRAFRKPCSHWPHPFWLLSSGDQRPQAARLGCIPSSTLLRYTLLDRPHPAPCCVEGCMRDHVRGLLIEPW